MIHWSGRRDSKNEKTGRHIETSPPAGYDMQIKVEYSLRNIIMMFVTADDSASAEKKRGATGLVSNGAEEGLKEMVTLMEAGEGVCWEAADRYHSAARYHPHALRACL